MGGVTCVARSGAGLICFFLHLSFRTFFFLPVVFRQWHVLSGGGAGVGVGER